MTEHPDWRARFLQQHDLPQAFLSQAQTWFDPLAKAVKSHVARANALLIVGINGCQGSGKSTLANYLVESLRESHHIDAIQLSLDDFYLPRADRQKLGIDVHPLLATRGVPGTHDIAMLTATLRQLGETHHFPIRLPRFDKASDDRQPRDRWPVIDSKPDVIVVEGWCLGALPQPVDELQTPVNELERRQDPEGLWREYVNTALAEFHSVYQCIDLWIMLQAPSFDCVFEWRLEQERKLQQTRPRGSNIMNEAELAQFIQHYQRLTEACLRDMPSRVDYLYKLDALRNITAVRPSKAWMEKESERYHR
ncbi:MAG: hypothetical protein AAGA91_13030 [Pseudomonadota bacterium]